MQFLDAVARHSSNHRNGDSYFIFPLCQTHHDAISFFSAKQIRRRRAGDKHAVHSFECPLDDSAVDHRESSSRSLEALGVVQTVVGARMIFPVNIKIRSKTYSSSIERSTYDDTSSSLPFVLLQRKCHSEDPLPQRTSVSTSLS